MSGVRQSGGEGGCKILFLVHVDVRRGACAEGELSMLLRYCENPRSCRIFCSLGGDVGEVVLRLDVREVESPTLSSVV